MIRPQKKRQQERDKMISGANKGDKIITIGGIHGVIQVTKDKTVIIKIADNVKVEIERSAISAVVRDSDGGTTDAKLLEPEVK
jgi:preprotein translocase subunit YajC